MIWGRRREGRVDHDLESEEGERGLTKSQRREGRCGRGRGRRREGRVDREPESEEGRDSAGRPRVGGASWSW